jgi:Recombination endonuclease VII
MDDEERKEKQRGYGREWFRKHWAEDAGFRDKHRAKTREQYREKKDEINEQRRERYATDPEYRHRRLRKYGLTFEEMQELMARQQGACGICEQPFHSPPHVDHCHVTGLVRGLLCRGCNLGLGNLKDNPDFAHKAGAYLERWILHVIELHIGEENDMPSNEDVTEDNNGAQLIRGAILHELNQPFGVEPPPPTNWLQAVSRALVTKAAQDLTAIKEVFDRVGGRMPSSPGGGEAAKQINVTWKYPASKLQRSAGEKTKGSIRSSPRSSNRAGASPPS